MLGILVNFLVVVCCRRRDLSTYLGAGEIPLACSFKSNLGPSLTKLQSRPQLSEAQLQKVVVACPSVLTCSFESNIGPKLDFLQEGLDISLKTLREYVISTGNKKTLAAELQPKLRYEPRLEACRLSGADPALVIRRACMNDACFYRSIGSKSP